MTAHDKSTQDVLCNLATDKTQGLSAAEVSARIAKYGENRLQEKKKKSMLQRFLDQFKDAMIIILLMFYYFIMIYAIKPIIEINKSLGSWIRYKIPFGTKTECRDELAELSEKIESITTNTKINTK